ncbi:DUF5067 domain-containing protein [Lysinibacillus sp. NPDC093692]|uniref:DUF5067 domain-containing protein n=1 Tax=Lysinibacillus sp. NPDC093692 TaxID=3390578 RepID=UPI003CFFA651
MKKKLIFSAALVLSIGLAGCGADSSKDEKPKEETKTTASTDKTADKETKSDGVYFKDGEVKIEDVKIKITETKVIPVGEKGNEYGEKPVFAIWYETTNLSDKEINPISAWIAVFTGIQDNNPNAVNELEVGSLPDDRFSNSQLENIKKDGTVENAVAYDLDDLETPVTLLAKKGLMGEELGTQDYPVK